MSARVLIAGADWAGDVLPGCARAATALGAEVRVLVTNRLSRRDAQLAQLQSAMRTVPLVGPRVVSALGRAITTSWLAAIKQKLEDVLGTWRPDVLLALVDGLYPVLSDVLTAWPRMHKIGWMMDDPFFFGAAHTFDLPAFDELYTVEESLVAPLRAATGRPVSNLPLAVDPHIYRPLDHPPVAKQHTLVFVGKSYRDEPAGLARRAILSHVASLGLEVWGDQNWKGLRHDGTDFTSCYRGGPIGSDEANAIYNRCEMAICVHHPQIRCGATLRSFAICAAGAFQLLEWRPGLDQLLEPGREVVTFGCGEELAECVRAYRVRQEEQLRIARAGLARVRAEHTYAHRLRTMLSEFLLPQRCHGS